MKKALSVRVQRRKTEITVSISNRKRFITGN